MKILLLGIGNPARRDDGLGPALAEAVERLAIPDLTVEAEYQVEAEDAAAVADHDLVLFADADAAGPEPFSLSRVAPARGLTFSSHSLEPSGVLGLAEEAFGRSGEGWLLAIRGYAFDELAEGLTEKARENLARALAFIEPALRTGALAEAAARLTPASSSSGCPPEPPGSGPRP